MRLVKCSKYIMYFNQIAGPKHHSFGSLIRLPLHKSGEMIYKSALTLDRWGKNSYSDPTIKTKFKFFRFETNTSCAPDIHVKTKNQEWAHSLELLNWYNTNHVLC